MTEEEAKTKWCHKAVAQNARHEPAQWGWDGRCIGSACMAWRFVVPLVEDKTLHGYCGLAGKP